MGFKRVAAVGLILSFSALGGACTASSESPAVGAGEGQSGDDGGGASTDEARAADGGAAARDARADATKHDGAASEDAATGDDDAQSGDASSCSACAVEDVSEVTGGPMPTDLFVDATDVYFSYHLGRHIYRAPKAGGATSIFASEPSGSLLYLTGDAARLYVVDFTASAYQIDEIAKTGGGFRTLYQSGFASNIDIDNFVVDGNVLYVAAGKNAGGAADLLSLSEPSAAASPVNAAWSPGHWLTASGANLYWSHQGHILRAPKSGVGTPVEIAWASSDFNPEIVADGPDVFYGMKYEVELHKITGTNDVALNPYPPAATFAWRPIVDATHVYVLASDSSDVGTIYRVPRAGGALEVFADQQAGARGLAQDATHVYWAAWVTDSSGSVSAHVLRKAK